MIMIFISLPSTYGMALRPLKRHPLSGVEDQKVPLKTPCDTPNIKDWDLPVDQRLLSPTRLKNSFLVFSRFSMHPSTQLVIVVALVFSTPRITMHRWLDSMTTATPCGFNTSMTA
jgi:hypothetical protein